MEADIKAYISAGLCAKLNDAMSAYDPDDLDDGAMSLWCDGDDVYAIPFSTSPFIICLLYTSVAGDTLLPHRASVISSTRRTDTPARYISMSASSTLLSRRRYRSMIGSLK